MFFSLLSDYEGLALSLLEAMGAGVVPVVSDLSSGIAQAVPADCGLRVPFGNLDAAAAALLDHWWATRCGWPSSLRAAFHPRLHPLHGPANGGGRFLNWLPQPIRCAGVAGDRRRAGPARGQCNGPIRGFPSAGFGDY